MVYVALVKKGLFVQDEYKDEQQKTLRIYCIISYKYSIRVKVDF